MRRIKAVYPTQVKAVGTTEEGVFEAIVSVFGNVDRVGDRVVKGAFAKTISNWQTKAAKGRFLPIYYSHQYDSPAMLLGKTLDMQERDEGLWVKGQLFMRKPAAQDVYEGFKEGVLDQFSFAYDVLDERRAKDGANELLDIVLHEVGPTPLGVNDTTHLVGVKSAIASHSTETSDAAWDGPQMWKNCMTDAAALKGACAWTDPDGDPETKAAYRFIHHFVDGEGKVGAASTKACSTGIGVLNGGRGGTTIPDDDRKGVYNHLAKHMRDAGMEPPELKADADVLKKSTDLEGSFEDTIEELDDAVRRWVASKYPGDDQVFSYIVASYPDSVIACVCDYGAGEETHYRFPYAVDNDETSETFDQVVLGEATQVDLETTVVPKAATMRAKAGRVLSAKNESDIKQAVTLLQGVLSQLDAGDGKHDEATDKTEEPYGVKAEDPDLVSELLAARLRAIASI